jgi:RimJ/RimL family protein N-acetyltransferase
VKLAIQRRGILLAPPDERLDLPWLFSQFEDPAIWEMFGFNRSGRARIMRGLRRGELVVGILHRIAPRKRIGFVVMFPPPPPPGRIDYWELGYAIPDPADRDAFSALSATDAMAHYMFEHLRVSAMGWRTRADNRAADAVIRRLGYQPYETIQVDGHPYTFYRLSQEGWAARRAKLDRGEAEHPSGTGATFVVLKEPPWTPVERTQP